MQTSLARRQRHRRNGTGGRHGGGGRAATRVAIALPLVLFSSLLLVGLVGFVTVVGAYGYFSQGLRDPREIFENLDLAQQTVIYDSSGKVELARFGDEKREVVAFEEIPPVLIDATTSIEDKTFWTNAGFDPIGIVKAGLDTLSGNERGASTITQQLVRARLLPASAFEGSKYERKIKEIIQSIRLTQAYGGEREGKEKVIETYLNNTFYGNQSYGIKAAARSYFGVTDLSKLTIAQAAILAAIPQSPSAFDLVRNAVDQEVEIDGKPEVRPVVPADSAIVKRRNLVLNQMLENRVLTLPGAAYEITDAEIAAAKDEPVVLAKRTAVKWRAAQFVWQVRKDLTRILCGDASLETCEAVDRGGYRVTTTLDWNMQKSAEKWVKAAVVGPNQKDTAAYLARLKVPDAPWIQKLRGKNIHNGALVAVDYRTGRILAYVGSADYYGKADDVRFQPQYDVLADGWRQPGSAFKPITYITGIQDRTMTAASLFMDVGTDFGGDYTPADADNLERGPLRLRQALSFSLNIPAVKAAAMNGPDHVFEVAKRFGIRFQAPRNQAGVSIGIGTLEVHPVDLVGAYGAIANGGVLMPRQTITAVVGPEGEQVFPRAGAAEPEGTPVVSPEAAFVISDILAANTDPKQNPYWGKLRIMDGRTRRPAALKTGTTNDTKDLAAYGFLAPPADPNAPAIAVGIWMGNSDNSQTEGVFSLDSTAPLYQAFLSEVSKGTPIAEFTPPPGVVQARVDAFSGMLPGPFTTKTVTEWFIEGTVPSRVDDTKVPVDIDSASGLLWQEGCVGPMATRGFLDLSGVEAGFAKWKPFTDDWIARAAKGPGVSGGPDDNRTAYFYNGSYQPYGGGWGAPFAPTETCEPGPTPPPEPPPCDPLFGPCPSPSEPVATVTLPDLSCLSLEAAAESLTAAGLSLGDVKPDDPGIDWVVAQQRPDPGSLLVPGASVELQLRDRAKVPGCG